ncbi:hypothetical protein Vi05172_g8188 [Venturia inaequalis]|nr:hypothetical protein Vi05172_g8188 [Venturia inaequalis]
MTKGYTGNTVFASLGFSNLPEGTTRTQLLKSLCAILCFILGALFFSSLHRRFTPQKRWVLILSFSIQVILIVTSALLVQSGSVDDDSPKRPVHAPLNFATRGFKDSPWDLLPIGLLSFQAAGQVVASRALECAQLPTIVISTLYADLVSDPSFFSGGLCGNAPRNRRVGGVVFYIMGAVLGGVFAASRYGSAGSLWVVALVKGAIVFGWIGWREKSEEKGG